MKLLKSDEYHEDMGSRIFISFERDADGKIQGAPPDVRCCSGYLEDDFDDKEWTHFIDDNLNSMFSDVDPVNFPKISAIAQQAN
jgi:hypothetical protein